VTEGQGVTGGGGEGFEFGVEEEVVFYVGWCIGQGWGKVRPWTAGYVVARRMNHGHGTR
jgi:hypothetical protein